MWDFRSIAVCVCSSSLQVAAVLFRQLSFIKCALIWILPLILVFASLLSIAFHFCGTVGPLLHFPYYSCFLFEKPRLRNRIHPNGFLHQPKSPWHPLFLKIDGLISKAKQQRKRYRQRKERMSSTCWFALLDGHTPRSKPGVRMPAWAFHMGIRDPHNWDITCCVPRSTRRKLDQKWSSREFI